ncbi:MAG: S1 RNA-binding domain-containing protein [Acidobacteriota bacterium]
MTDSDNATPSNEENNTETETAEQPAVAAAPETAPEAEAPAESKLAEATVEAVQPTEDPTEAETAAVSVPVAAASATEPPADDPAEAPTAEVVVPVQEAAADSQDAPAQDASASEEAAVEPPAVETPETPGGEPAADPAAEAAPAEAPAEPAPEPTMEEILAANPQLVEIHAAIESKIPVEGKVIGWNKGGFHVTLGGTPAFCPKSQIELGKPKKAASYVDRSLTFRVIEIKDAGKRVVVSRADILKEQRQQLLQTLSERVLSGEPMTGKVTSITDFGAFVDLGGLEGLVHLSQLSRKRVETPRDVVQIGNEVQVKVTKIEKGGDRISLSMKALEPDPWKNADERYPTGSQFTGKILRKTDFGLFVELEDGLEGLVHTSQLPLGKKLEDSEFEIGNEITGWIRDANPERRRLSLALREVAQTNPWKDVHERFTEGAEVEGQVEQVAKFGVFVMLEPGLTGLLPFSAMQRGPNSTARPPQPGQGIKVQISSIDAKKRRISLAPIGSKLEGTKADYQEYKKSTDTGTGLGAMAAAFAKLNK